MFLRPFEHQRQCSPTQMPLENLQRGPSTPRTRRAMTSKRLPSGIPPPGGRTATERSCKLPV